MCVNARRAFVRADSFSVARGDGIRFAGAAE